MESWSLNSLGLVNKIIADYIDNDEKLKPFYNYRPNIEGLLESAKQRAKHPIQVDRNLLIEVLEEKLNKVDDGTFDLQKSRANIHALKEQSTFTITTGQQLHLYLGPAYFINKIFTCIKVSENFNQSQADYNTIPIFWLASEDHDIEEISSVELFGQEYKANLASNKITGSQSTNPIKELTSQLAERLGDEANSNELFQICNIAYNKYDNLSDATTYIIYRLFSTFGIVVMDANNPRLKQKFNAIAKNELEHETTTQKQQEVRTIFESNNWHYQVMPRTSNLFTVDSKEIRIATDSPIFDKNTTYSPNALLRPLYQEIILPNISYIGGAAECNYWLQLKPTFDFYNIHLPVIWLRDTIHIDQSKNINKLLALELSVQQIATFDEVQYSKKHVEENLPKELIGKMEETGEHIQFLKKDINNHEWITISKEYENMVVDVKKAYRNLKTTLLEGAEYQHKLKKLNKHHETYFNGANLQERTKSCLSLTTNFQMFHALKTSYLTSNLSHAGYYLIGK